MTNEKTKSMVLVLSVAALMVLASTGVASATSQNFYFHGGNNMDKTEPVGSCVEVVLPSGNFIDFYDAAATVDGTFGENSWTTNVNVTNMSGNSKLQSDIYLVDNSNVIIKRLASGEAAVSTTGWLTIVCADDTSTTQEFAIGNKLAAKVTNSGSSEVKFAYDGADCKSRIESPSTDPGFPVPELPAVILTSTGLLALFGYVVYRGRKQ